MYKDKEKRKEYNRQYYLDNLEKFKKYAKNRTYTEEQKARKLLWGRKQSKELNMFRAAKHRAKTKGLDFNITIEDIVIPEMCPVLLIKIVPNTSGARNPIKSSPVLDRIDNSKGYIKGNVQVISSWANQRKGDLSIEEISRLYQYVKAVEHETI